MLEFRWQVPHIKKKSPYILHVFIENNSATIELFCMSLLKTILATIELSDYHKTTPELSYNHETSTELSDYHETTNRYLR
jgi:hypothetical protein